MGNIKEKFLSELKSLSPCGGVLVAFSGGADSTCMLKLFAEAKKNGIFPYEVAAAHLNHSLRGDESNRDEAFCREFCEKNGIRFFAKTVDVASLAKESGCGTEEAARVARYAFFDEVLKSNEGLAFVATAHNKEDFCETMLLNLVRGSGIDGLRSIPRVRGDIIRPMLSISRGEILEYLDENGIGFVTDSTNLEDVYSRNKLRHNVMPVLAEISAGYADSMSRAAALLARDADYLNAQAKKLYGTCVENGVLYTKKAQNFHPVLLSRIIKMLYNDSGFSGLAEVHLDSLCEQVKNRKENFSLSLHGCTALCERGVLYFVSEAVEAAEFSVKASFDTDIALPCGITVRLSSADSKGATPIRRASLGRELILRSRLNGDKITMFGKTHKIKRIISDKKLNKEEKSKLFFLVSDGKIIYANLPAVSDEAFIKKGGTDCIFITTKETLTPHE